MLLHGKNFDSSCWAGPIGWLRQSGFRVVVPDQLGFNKSSKPDLDYTFEALAANTMALADALSLSNLSIIGHSTGGMLAVRLTSIYPERIQQLVLEDPIGLIDYRNFVPTQTTETLEETERRYTVETYRAFIAHYFPILPPDEYEPLVEWRMRVALSGEYERFVRATALTYQMICRGPVSGLFRDLKPPVLLLAGEQDRTIPLSAYAPPDVRAQIPTLTAAAVKSRRRFHAVRSSHFRKSVMSHTWKWPQPFRTLCKTSSGAELSADHKAQQSCTHTATRAGAHLREDPQGCHIPIRSGHIRVAAGASRPSSILMPERLEGDAPPN